MADNTFYNEILTEHTIRPLYKRKLPEASFTLEGINPNCGDDIILNLKIEEGRITDGSFEGSGCAISQASVDMMLDLVVGKTREEALRLAEIFLRMIKGEASEKEIEELDEASILKDISHMPARVKCAVLGWHTMKEIFEKEMAEQEEKS